MPCPAAESQLSSANYLRELGPEITNSEYGMKMGANVNLINVVN